MSRKNYSLLLLLCCLNAPFASAQWTATAGPEGGNVFAIEKVGNELWAGTEGGLYISADQGASWVRSPLVRPEDNVSTIQVFPGEILLGVTRFTYDDGYTADEQMSCYRSIDGGATFSQHTISNWRGPIDAFYRFGDTLFCKKDYQWARSTDDGETWTTLTLPTPHPDASAIDGQRMIAASYYGMWRSEDGGDTWMALDSIGYIKGFYLEGNLVIASTSNYSFYRSTDFGLTWQRDTLHTDQFDAAALRRGNQGELWQPGETILRSFDDGQTWDTLAFSSGGFRTAYDAWQEGDGYVAATYLGVFKTVDSNWVAQNSGLTISKVYVLDSDGQGRLNAYTNAGPFQSEDEGTHWQPLPPYDYAVGRGVYDDTVAKGDTTLALSTGQLWRSTDAGQTWNKVFIHGRSVGAKHFAQQNGLLFIPAYDSIYYTADFGYTWEAFDITPALYDSYNDILLLNGWAFVVTNAGEIYRSTDNFATWTPIYSFSSPGAGNANRLLYFASRIYVLGPSGSAYSADGGTTWQAITPQGVPTNQWGDPFGLTNYLAVENLLFATIPFNGVWVSSDGGTHWQALNDGLDNLRGRYLTLHDNKLYLGTSTGGVYRRNMDFLSVSGLVYNDLNNNGLQDVGEPPLPNILVAAEPLHSYATSASTGSYGLVSEAFADTLRAVANTPYATIHPPYYVVNQAGNGFHFGIHYLPNVQDLSVSAANAIVIRPGFASQITITAKNIGTMAAGPATVKLLLPAQLIFTGAYPAPTLSGDTLVWQIGLLQAFESLNLGVQILCSPDLINGQSLDITAFIDPIDGDANPINNQYTYREPVVGSYDPNDKRVRPENGITPTQIAQGDRLEYTIRFENTGNYLADFVRIVDTLSTLVDVASLEIIAASHPVTWSVRGNGIVEFTFRDIFLLPSSTGNGEGHGFVKYSVRCRPGTLLNADIRNTAYIFFDFNTPVQTNTTSTVVKNTVRVNTLVDVRLALEVAPNPASDYLLLTWSQPTEAGEIHLYAADGTRVFQQSLAPLDRQARFRLPSLPTGTYQLVWRGRHQVPLVRSITIAH